MIGISIFNDTNVAKHHSYLQDKYVVVLADNASNNIPFACKSHYIDCVIKALGIDNSLGIPRKHLRKYNSFQPKWRTGSFYTLQDTKITLLSLQTTLYCWVCRMLHGTSFQVLDIYFISGLNRASELLWY